MSIQLEILSPEKVVFKGNVDEVIAPGILGEIDVLPQHAHYVTVLAEGTVTYKQATQSDSIKIAGGVAQVSQENIVLLVDGLK